jgi:hypothetical protein
LAANGDRRWSTANSDPHTYLRADIKRSTCGRQTEDSACWLTWPRSRRTCLSASYRRSHKLRRSPTICCRAVRLPAISWKPAVHARIIFYDVGRVRKRSCDERGEVGRATAATT